MENRLKVTIFLALEFLVLQVVIIIILDWKNKPAESNLKNNIKIVILEP